MKIENSAYPGSSVITADFLINVSPSGGCSDTSWSIKTMSTTIVYIQSGSTTLNVFNDGTSYYTPPTIPCSLPTHSFVGTAPNGLNIDLQTG